VVLVRLVEELVAHHPGVALRPVLLVQVGEPGVAQPGGQRHPPLRQVAVLGLQPVVVELPVGEAAGHVHELVRGRALAQLAAHRHREVQAEEDGDPEPDGRPGAGAVHGSATGP
jgi:hypothetical protein